MPEQYGAGYFDEYIVIEVPTGTRDSFNEPVEAWGTFAESWANVRPVAAYEVWYTQRTEGQASHIITIRWVEGVDMTMRVSLEDGRKLNITGPPLVIGKNEYMRLHTMLLG